jgi:ABC-2 type transport system ATP-binding protein
VLVRLLDPRAGVVTLGGVDTATLAGDDVRRRVALVGEHDHVFATTVRENLRPAAPDAGDAAYAAVLRRVRLGAWLDGLPDGLDTWIGPDEISGGERRRLAVARALLTDPAVLVLDEPTEGLDPNQRVEIRRLIGQLGRERTVILSTHILPEVQFTCSRLLIINLGRIVADGPVDDLVSRAKDGARISVEASGAGIADRLAELPGVRGVEPRAGEGDRLRVTMIVAGAEDLRPRVFELAKASGWTLFELHQEAGSLEDLFRQLTTDQEPA